MFDVVRRTVLCCVVCSLLQIDSHSLTDLKHALCALVDALPAGAYPLSPQLWYTVPHSNLSSQPSPTKRTRRCAALRCAVESPAFR